jgi:predicted HTH transcriptional regulator
MTPEKLTNLVAAGENLDIEFKGEKSSPLNDRALVEAVICLANRPGDEPGWLLIGVEDDGQITGARPRHEGGITDPRRVQALIANRTRPTLTCRAELVQIQGKEVLAVEVPASRHPVGTTEGLYQRRALGGRGTPECLPYHFHEMQGQQADRGLLDYSALAVPEARWEDLDPLEFDRFRRSIRENLQKSEAEARSVLSLLVESGTAEARGDRRERVYHLSAAAYRGMGERAAYVRQRGFEPIQQEQMVLQYVQTHGSISRPEVAELCRITDSQAYRLLRRLVEQNVLRPSGGKARSARYVAATD